MTNQAHTSLITQVYKRLSQLLKLAFALVFLSGGLTGARLPTLIEQVSAQGQLIVASQNGPTTFYRNENGYVGFEYSLLKSFAKKLDVELVIQEHDNLSDVIRAVKERKAHIGAAGLTVTPKRAEKLDFSEPYAFVTQDAIYRTGTAKPRQVEDLVGQKLVVLADSAHAERLRQLRRSLPDLIWEESYNLETLDLIEKVHTGELPFAIVDSNSMAVNRGLFPRAKKAFSISEPEAIAWAFDKRNEKSLKQAADQFIEQLREKGKLAQLQESFYGHIDDINYSGALVFIDQLSKRFPKWRDPIVDAADTNELDWKLLAAISYQESHWNPKAKSPTGVRGFMMLTRNTAKEMGIKNRLNAIQSIRGGAAYYKKLLERLPEQIKGKDRTWLALAAYNIGFGHLQDARLITQNQGDDPNRWADVKKYLPLLMRKQYYKHTRHGYARGNEAVTYVQNIRNYYSVIAWKEMENKKQRLANTQKETDHTDKPETIISSAISSALEELIEAEASAL